MKIIVVGSRRSQLALTQTNWVISQLKKLDSALEYEVHEILTKGDRILDVTLSKVGGKGLFVKEIEQALLDGKIDFAVHSMKDMPALLPPGLVIGAIPERVNYRDVFISNSGASLDELPEGAVIGTSSLRRQAQLLAYRPDLKIVPLRGNIDTRLRKLKEEGLDAIILAAAGLERMGWDEVGTHFISEEISLPAVGQGALAIQCREDDPVILPLLQKLHHAETAQAITAERSFLDTLHGGCQVPIGALAHVEGGQINLTGMVATPDGKTIIKEHMTGENPLELGKTLAEHLKQHGAAKILAAVTKELDAGEDRR